MGQQTKKRIGHGLGNRCFQDFHLRVLGVPREKLLLEKIEVGIGSSDTFTARIISMDTQNDLALLKPEKSSDHDIATIKFAIIRNGDVELGESVLVSGFPYGDLVSKSVKITSGIVSSTMGLGNNSGQFQIDAAIQPGNSGGPILDKAGRIVGVVVAQLNKLKIAEAIGSLPENTNFGIKGSALTAFLESAGVNIERVGKESKLPLEKVAQMAASMTIMIHCAR